MGFLRYQGYMGSVEYNEKEEILHGRVQGMRDVLLNYKGKSVAELEKNFQIAVDKYLDKCHSKGEDPKRPYNGPLNVRLGPDLHARAANMAERLEITLNAFIKEAVEKYLRSLEEYERI